MRELNSSMQQNQYVMIIFSDKIYFFIIQLIKKLDNISITWLFHTQR